MSTIPKAQAPHVSGEIVQPLKEVADLERNHVLLPTPNDLPQSDTPAPGVGIVLRGSWTSHTHHTYKLKKNLFEKAEAHWSLR